MRNTKLKIFQKNKYIRRVALLSLLFVFGINFIAPVKPAFADHVAEHDFSSLHFIDNETIRFSIASGGWEEVDFVARDDVQPDNDELVNYFGVLRISEEISDCNERGVIITIKNSDLDSIGPDSIINVDDANYAQPRLGGDDCTSEETDAFVDTLRDRGTVGVLAETNLESFQPPPPPEPEEEPKTCAGESGSPFGWLICPVIEAAQAVLKWIYEDALGPLLNFDVGSAEGLRDVWGGFRTIANLIFIIAFFIVIYSAATGNILSAYDVRKLLPRLFIVAILVQLSFFFSVTALDISNAVGSGVRSLILYPVSQGDDPLINPGGIPTQDCPGPDATDVPCNVFTDAVDLIAGTAVGVIMAVVLIILLVYSLMGIILLAGVFIVRDIGIVVLMVVSPIAFALAVLPGTESYFRNWWKWFFGLLAIYPIISAFLAAGELVAGIWTASDAFVWPIGFIIATVAFFLPYFTAIKVLGFAGKAAGALTGAFNTFNDKVNKFKDSGTYQRTRQRAVGNAWNKAATSKAGRSTVGRRALSSRTLGRRAGIAAQGLEKLNQEDAAIAENFISSQVAGMDTSAEEAFLRQHSVKGTDGMKRASMKRMLVNKDIVGLEKAWETLESTEEGRRLLDNFKKESAADLNSTARHLLVGQEGEGRSRKANGALALAGATPAQLSTQHVSTVKSTMGTLTSEAAKAKEAGRTDDERKFKAAIDKMTSAYSEIRQNGNLAGNVSDKTYDFIDEVSNIRSSPNVSEALADDIMNGREAGVHGKNDHNSSMKVKDSSGNDVIDRNTGRVVEYIDTIKGAGLV